MDPSQEASQEAAPTSDTSPYPPQLQVLDSSRPHDFSIPSKQINDGSDVAYWTTSKAYRDIGQFVLQLNRALCPRKNASGPPQTFALVGGNCKDPKSVVNLRVLLEQIASFIDQAPPDPGPRRFGNTSFRRWHQLLEDRVEELLRKFVPGHVLGFGSSKGSPVDTSGQGPGDTSGSGNSVRAIDELKAYLLGSFGSAQRLDYGTGHELSFLAFLGCLWKLGAFRDGTQVGDIERSIVLGVFEPYLQVVRRLILSYTLEPAGSHGVWGLDDHFFLPYIFGSAQLTRPISADEAMPLEGSVERAPKPGDVLKPEAIDRLRETNMYFSAVGFINDVKKGPFWEHSPILYDVSGIKDGWGKINKGMIKMYNAEVLMKFPVVQHFPFGSLFSWDVDSRASAPQQTVHMSNQPAATCGGPVSPQPACTAVPLAPATHMPKTSAPPGIPHPRAQRKSSGARGAAAPPNTMRVGPTMLPPGPVRPSGPPGTAGNQISITKAPWAK